MKLWFCEACGKRVTDADLESGEARDKQLKGVYCKSCAQNTLTQPFEALRDVELREEPRTSSPKIVPLRPRPSVPAPAAPATPRKRQMPALTLAAGAAGIFVIVAAVYFLSGGKQPELAKKAPPPADRHETPHPAEPEKSAHTETPPPKIPAPVPTPTPPDRTVAEPPSLREEQPAHASSAAAHTPAPPEPAPPAVPATAGRELFNGKDLTGLTFGQGGNAEFVKVEDGVLCFDSKFSGRVDFPAPVENYTVELQVAFEPNEHGGPALNLWTAYGKCFLHRLGTENWITLRVTVADGALTARTVSGDYKFGTDKEKGRPGVFALFMKDGCWKKVRGIRLVAEP